ncbi:radical SAM protein, partial [archaeon]
GVVYDNFLSNPLRAEKICDEIKERKLDFYWFCEGRVNEINSILMEKMKAVGCQTIYFGIESGSEKILKYYNKNITPSQSIKAVNAAKKTGMNIVGSFIVGAPVETKSEVVENLDLIRKLGVDVPQINILSVNPGTALWNEMILKNSEIGNYWKTGIQPVKIGMCEYSYEWLNDAVNDTYKKILFSPSFLSHQTIKSLTDPYRLKMIKKMAGLGSYKKS